MKNNSLKNLIALFIFVVFVVGANIASASVYDGIPTGYNVDYYSAPSMPVYANNNSQNYYNNYPAQQPAQQYNYNQQQPYNYVQAQPQVQYVTAPQPAPQVIYIQQPAARTEIKYVTSPATTSTQYVTTGNTQGASVIGATSNTRQVVAVGNTGTTGNTGQYVSYDNNSMGASVYASQPVVYDTNGVAALTVGGSGGFMPSSVFQWFLLIILILAIVIIARMISKTFLKDPHGLPAH